MLAKVKEFLSVFMEKLKGITYKNAVFRTPHHTHVDDILLKLDTAGMLLNLFFRELLVLCIFYLGI